MMSTLQTIDPTLLFAMGEHGLSVKGVISVLGFIGIGLAFLFIVVGGIFVFLRWGFRRLYGNYYHKLKRTLKELNEIEE